MDHQHAAPHPEEGPPAPSWNPALRSEKGEVATASPKHSTPPQPESSSEEEEEDTDGDGEEDEEEEEEEDEYSEQENDGGKQTAGARAEVPVKPFPAALPTSQNAHNTSDAHESQAKSNATPAHGASALAKLPLHHNDQAPSFLVENESSSEDDGEEESDEDHSGDEQIAREERPAENYEHQGEATALEEAVNNSESTPLVTDVAPTESDDWGNSEDVFDLGNQAHTIPLQTPQAEAIGTTVGDDVIGNTTVGGNKGADLDWGAVGDEDDFFSSSATGEVRAAETTDINREGHVEQSSIKESSKNEWDLDLDLDDDFLEEQDTSAIELSDDEGFLEDDTPDVPQQSLHPTSTSSNRYTPQPSPVSQAEAPVSSPYAPQSQFANPQKTITPAYGGFGQNLQYQQQQQARPPMASSAQSFADKAKGGYASPYDMPDDIVTTRRRPTPRTSLPATQPTPPPPRTSSISSNSDPSRSLPPPSNMPAANLSPPSSAHSMQGQMTGVPSNVPSKPSQPVKPASNDFFAELPVTSKPKPTGRYTPQQNSTAHSPALSSPSHFPPKERTASWSSLRNEVLPDSVGPQPHLRQPEQLPMFPSQPSVPARQNSLPIPQQTSSVPSSRYSPAPPPSAPTGNSRYSPAPPSAHGTTTSRYSPAAQGAAHTRYVSEPISAPPRPPSQPYAPRTSSPLAFHSTAQQEGDNSLASESHVQHQPGHHISQSADALPRPPFRSPLEGVNENEEQDSFVGLNAPQNNRSQTPPLRSSPSSVVGSPLKKGSYTPQYPPTSQNAPSRSLSQSPAASRNHSTSAYGAFPAAMPYGIQSSSVNLPNMIPDRRQAPLDYECIVPEDERASDALQRWKGYPIFTWGLGGTVVSSFPKQIPRYGGAMTAPMVKCSPGEVRVQNIKEVLPLSEDVVKFPGPLKNKNKKKDVQAWLGKKIESLESQLQEPSFLQSMTHEGSARHADKTLLLRILQFLVENDGRLEGEVAEAAVRKLFSPPGEDASATEASFSTAADIVGRSRSNTSSFQAEPVDARAIEDLQIMLAKGEREKAVWHAVDQRLWGHAMLLSSTLTKDIWKQVVQEFVRKEVKKVGRSYQALAVLYEVFAGNHEDCVDELVPASARAGFQMMSTDGAGAAHDAKQSLDKWHETVALILNNRSEGDASALVSLGRLLAQYGRVEASHICFIFARAAAHIGGVDDAQSDIVLLGLDHRQYPLELGLDLEPILLTEVYEFALSLSAPGGTFVIPHLQNYKLVHAHHLAEYGHRTDAQAYCDTIAATTIKPTKMSPYYSTAFLAALDDLSRRLSQSPKDNSSSWISKPSMDRVGTSLLSKFNNFIAGDDEDAASAKLGGAEIGPFAKIAGDSPTITPSQSNADLYGAYSGYGAPVQPVIASNSRYAPSNAHAPRTSSEQQRSRYEPRGRPSMESMDGQRSVSDSYMPLTPVGGSYSPQLQFSPPRQAKAQTYSPLRAEHNASQPSYSSPYLPTQPVVEESASTASLSGYQPQSSFDEPPVSQGDNGTFSPYAPMQSTLDVPSYEPYNPADDDDEKEVEQPKKKKSFMDDDDENDDIISRAAALKSSSKSKSEADRQADEAFRKAAELDAKRDKEAAAAKKGGWLSGWFKKDPNAAPGPIKAKLGEESSFYYDPDLGKWVNKKGGTGDDTGKPSATPPPPKGPPMAGRSASGGAAPPTGPPGGLMKPPTSAPMRSSSMPPPMAAPGSRASTPGIPSDTEGPKPPTLARPSFGAASGPPSRPSTSMSNASSIDDLLGAPQARKGVSAKKKKGGRYVDVFPQGQAS